MTGTLSGSPDRFPFVAVVAVVATITVDDGVLTNCTVESITGADCGSGRNEAE